MPRATVLVAALAGVGVGVLITLVNFQAASTVNAAASDRFQDYVICTGAVSINPRLQTDGVWLLDYRSGKLLGTVVDKAQGKIVGWAEVDLAAEYDVKPHQDVHFIMTTGYITQGQSALYVAETSTGKFGVYTMGPGESGSGIVIRRHDMTSFRTQVPAVQPAAAATIPGMPGVPAAVVPGKPAFAPPAPTVPTPNPLPALNGPGLVLPTSPK